MTNHPYHEATRRPDPIMWRPVTEYTVIYIDGEPKVLTPGRHVELLNERTGQHWRNDAHDFAYNYVMTEEGRIIFEKHYPGVLDERQNTT